MVFARNLDEKQSRYRHPKTEDFTLLTLFTELTKEKRRIKHFAADSRIFWVRVKKLWVSTPASEEPSTGTQASVFNSLDFSILASFCKA